MSDPSMPMPDPYDLERFAEAQEGDYGRAIGELSAGRKTTHWIWYVFPQLTGLGRSEMAQRYGIASIEEAREYLAHPILGPRLVRAVEAALGSGERDPHALFGSPDDMKVRSSLTLFAAADPTVDAFRDGLKAFYGGDADPATLEKLGLDGLPVT